MAIFLVPLFPIIKFNKECKNKPSRKNYADENKHCI